MLFCSSIIRTTLLLLSSCVWFNYSIASTNAQTPVSVLKARAAQQQLHQAEYWHALMHYYPSRFQSENVESHIDDTRFFLAGNGKHNPNAELIATIDALFGDPDVLPDPDIQCRFVAREKWLRKMLELPSFDVPETCRDYHSWRGRLGQGSVTLVFPASYLNSPSSMFGHTLLRFDPENIDSNSPLLSWSLNFAADVGDESMSAGYAFKGIAGGYPGKFNSIPYFEKLQEYGAIENRDIWEYRLDLNAEEIDRMLDHAWELRDISFDYYFFRQNCSFRLLELIDLARPGLNLADQFPLTAIPADTVKAFANAGIVSHIDYRASLGSRLNHTIDAIEPDQRHWIDKVEQSPDVTENAQFTMLDATHQAQIIRAANELLTFKSRRTEMNDATAQRRLQLLTLVSQLPTEKKIESPRPARPELAHETTMLSLSRGQQDKKNYTELSLRLSYHDALDRNAGYSRGAGIVLGDVKLRRNQNDDVHLETFDLVKLQSFNDRYPQLNSISWELTAGLTREPLLRNNRLGARLDGYAGKSLRLDKHNISYVLLGASARQYVNPGAIHLNAHARLGVLSYNRLGVTRLEAAVNSFQSLSLQTTLSVQHNLPLSRNHALRFQASTWRLDNDSDNRISLSYRLYF